MKGDGSLFAFLGFGGVWLLLDLSALQQLLSGKWTVTG